MIDLHCHLLPGIDDGARDLDDAVAMARQGAADGVEVICATPHIRHDHDVRIHELAGRARELQDGFDELGVGVEVVAAGEVAATIIDGLSDDELREVALSDRWVLLEPAPGPLDDHLDDAVETLARRGYRSLIAHPERHLGPGIRDRLAALIERGALVQATAALLAEGDAVPGMLELAHLGLIHVLGSDAHSSLAGRPVALSSGLERLNGVELLVPHLDWIARRAPAAILRGEELEAPYPAPA